MNRTEKAAAVAALEADLAKASNAIVFGFAGLKVNEVTELRRQVRATQSKYLVVKNTLALLATRGTALEAVARHFTGPTGVAYNRSSPVALAKVLTAFARTNPNLVFKAAVVEGLAVEAKQIAAIAELPSREQLVSKLLFLIQSPMRRLVTVLNGPVRSLAGTLHQIADQKAKSGGADAAPADS
ncbi:MAG: 50S ribosomal protein L10 [Thermoanaerobaculia bacterium]